MNGHIKKILFFMSFIFLYFLFPNSIVNATELPQSIAYKYHALGINAYNPCSSTASDTSASCVSPTGDQITWIGDSYSVGAKDIIESTFPGVDLGPIDSHPYIHCSKHIGMGDSDTNPETCSSAGLSGVDLAKKIKDAGKMRPYLVFALATNDVDDPSSHLAELMNIIGDGTQVILTTARTEDGSDYTKTNEAIRKVAEEHANVVVADWANSSEYKAEFFSGDSTHPFSNGGMETWVNVIKSALPQSCSGAGLLSGDTVEERVWNYLVSANITNVSNRPEVIAGILGNINTESGFNPFAMGPQYRGYYYYGLFQDYGGNNNNALRDEINAAVGADYWSTNDTTSAPQDAIDKAIEITLGHLINDEEEFKDFISKIDRPTKKTGAEGAESYAELFLVTYERAVDGSSPINDLGVCQIVQEMYSGAHTCNYQGTSMRREFAREYYEKFASSATTSTTTSSSINTSSSSTPLPSTGDDCSKLAELRQELWNSASEKDRSDFMKTVCEENCSIAGVEGYMNQVIAYGSKHGTSVNGGDGTLAKWLDVQCEAFRPASASCRGEHTISSEEQSWIDEALNGSNHINFAIGNATGGSDVGAGKIVCVWNGEKCRDDVNYDQPSGTPCSAFTSSSSDECWGTEMAEGWNEKLGITNCGSSGSSCQGVSVTWQDGWITGGIDGYIKNAFPPDSSVSAGDSEGEYETTSPNGGTGPNKITLHNTEGSGDVTKDKDDILFIYGDGPEVSAHFTIDIRNKKLWQHHPINKHSGALYHHNDLTGGVQIEVMGYAGPTYESEYGNWWLNDDSKFSESDWDYLATLLVAISQETGIPLTSSVSTWIPDNSDSQRFKTQAEFDNYIGVLGHMHAPVPKEDHTDPYDLWSKVEPAINRVQNCSDTSSASTCQSGGSGLSGTTVIDCKNIKASNIGKNGLTEEQAALFLARYAANENNVTKNYLDSIDYWEYGTSSNGYGRNQCVALAVFFVNNFTKQTLPRCQGGSCVPMLSGTGPSDSPFSLFDGSGHVGIIVGYTADGTPIDINNNGHSQDGNAIGGYDMSKFNANDFLNGGTGTQAVTNNAYGTGYNSTAKLDVDTDKLIKYLCTGQL